MIQRAKILIPIRMPMMIPRVVNTVAMSGVGAPSASVGTTFIGSVSPSAITTESIPLSLSCCDIFSACCLDVLSGA